MLLSDKDIRAAITSGRVALDPYDPAMVQPSSVDVRIDRYFRVFENHRYPHIDPSIEQAELTRLVEPDGDEPFILHPGEFVLGSTYEVVSLPDDVSARLEGKALAISTPIPTPSGWTTMGALRVGDQVFGPDGKPRRVVAATEVMTDPAVLRGRVLRPLGPHRRCFPPVADHVQGRARPRPARISVSVRRRRSRPASGSATR